MTRPLLAMLMVAVLMVLPFGAGCTGPPAEEAGANPPMRADREASEPPAGADQRAQEEPDQFSKFMRCAWQEDSDYKDIVFLSGRLQDTPQIPLALSRDIETLVVGVVDFRFREEGTGSSGSTEYQEFVVAGIREVEGADKVVFLFDELRFNLFEKERFLRVESNPNGPRVKLLMNTLSASRYAGACRW